MSLRLEPDLRAQPGPRIDPSPNAPDPLTDHWTGSDPDVDPSAAQWLPPDATPGAIRVTAVLVAHDGAAFLPRTLDAIDAQSRPPDHLVAVDAGSLDGSGDLLTLATGRLLRLNRDTSFGDAVQAALTALDGTALAPSADPRPDRPDPARPLGLPDRVPGLPYRVPGLHDRVLGLQDRAASDWLWLLHDDSAPAPDVLELLIAAVEAGPSIGIAGCKQVSWDDGRRLLDVGFTTSRLGARVTGVDVDDVDQGQLDQRSDVLAVGTAGMLVRRDVWDRLGGPDPALAHARDDLDLCRRAHLAGLRVVVVPAAVIAHATATATGRRGSTGRASWALRDRRAAIHLRLASVPLLLLPFLVLWLAAAGTFRALGRLALKQPDRAAAELVAFGLALSRPLAWMRARRRVRAGRELPRRDFRRLLAGPRLALRQRRDTLSAYLRTQEEAWAVPAGAAQEATAATPAPGIATPDGPAISADTVSIAFDDERERPRRRPQARIGFAVAGLVGIAGLAGMRLLLGGTGVPVGPALLPAPETATRLWTQAMSGWRPAGLGQAGAADPFDAVLAVIAWPLGGSTRAAAELLLLGALPLAALLAWWAAGGVTRSRALRAWAALGWAAAPSLLSAVAAGRLGAIVAHLALPPAALALARAVGARPAPAAEDRLPAAAIAIRARGSISAASAAGLVLTVLIAAAPALAAPALIAVLVTAVAARTGRALLVWAVAVPAVLLLPWWLAVARDPWLLLAEPGGASAVEAGTGGWPALLWPADPAALNPGPVYRAGRFVADLTTFADAAFWLRAAAVALVLPLLAIGLSALMRRGTGRPVAVLWTAGLAGLAVAVLVPVLDRRIGPDGELHGWPGAGVSLLALGVLAAALVRLDGAAGRLRARSLGSLHWLAVGSGVVSVLAPMIVLAVWALGGWTADPDRWVHRGSPDVLPAVAEAEAEGPAATRTLVLKLTPAGVRWSLYRTGGPRIGQDSAATLSDLTSDRAAGRRSSDDPVLAAIGGLLSDSGRDQTTRLADLDVGSVLLLAPARDSATAALDTAPGLVRVATPNGGVLWRVELDGSDGGPSRAARVRVLSATGQVTQTLPSTGIEVHADLAAGPAGRVLVLAERADPGWQARLGGVRLTPTTNAGWAQAFELPAAGGQVSVQYAAVGGGLIGMARLGVIGLALLVAVPLPRRRPRFRPPPASRARPEPFPADPPGRRTRLPSAAHQVEDQFEDPFEDGDRDEIGRRSGPDHRVQVEPDRRIEDEPNLRIEDASDRRVEDESEPETGPGPENRSGPQDGPELGNEPENELVDEPEGRAGEPAAERETPDPAAGFLPPPAIEVPEIPAGEKP